MRSGFAVDLPFGLTQLCTTRSTMPLFTASCEQNGPAMRSFVAVRGLRRNCKEILNVKMPRFSAVIDSFRDRLIFLARRLL